MSDEIQSGLFFMSDKFRMYCWLIGHLSPGQTIPNEIHRQNWIELRIELSLVLKLESHTSWDVDKTISEPNCRHSFSPIPTTDHLRSVSLTHLQYSGGQSATPILHDQPIAVWRNENLRDNEGIWTCNTLIHDEFWYILFGYLFQDNLSLYVDIKDNQIWGASVPRDLTLLVLSRRMKNINQIHGGWKNLSYTHPSPWSQHPTLSHFRTCAKLPKQRRASYLPSQQGASRRLAIDKRKSTNEAPKSFRHLSSFLVDVYLNRVHFWLILYWFSNYSELYFWKSGPSTIRTL